MAAESYWGSNPVTTTVLVSPSPTTTVFTVASITDFIDEQFLLVEVAGDFERAQIDSISGSQITLKEALSDAPDVPGAVKSGRTLLTNSKLNGGAVFHADDITSLEALSTSNAPENTRYQVPEYGIYRLNKGGSLVADGELVLDAADGGNWILETPAFNLLIAYYN